MKTYLDENRSSNRRRLPASTRYALLLLSVAGAAACSSNNAVNNNGNTGTGGIPSGAGGARATGGNTNAGGSAGSAGNAGASGMVSDGSAGTSSGGAAGTSDAGETGAAGNGRADAGRPAEAGSGRVDGGADAARDATASVDGATTSCLGVAPGNHYVDATLGSDAADGATPATAWQSLTRVNAETFRAGDHICFRAGGSWTGTFEPHGSGTSAAPIVVDQYGAGAKPHIAAAAGALDTVSLVNLSYWEINNLEVTNTQAGPGDFRGIRAVGRDVGVLHHIAIRNSWVHDVTGEVNWIGGSTADNIPPWVTFQTGWDVSKRTGGIVFEVESTNGTPTWFDDVRIENNVIQDTSFGGIIVKQLDGGRGWGVRNSATDTRFLPHTNVVVRGNYISQTGTIYGCNALYITGSRGVIIEGNVAKDAGTSSIEVYNADDVMVQKNETYRTVRKAGGADFNGIDADRATTKAIVQYNYIHDNGDGILLAQFAFGDSVVRYNLIVNNSRYGINLHSDAAATNQTYNNLFFADGLAAASLVNTSGAAADTLVASYAIRNNVLHTTRTGDAAVAGAGVSYASNLYSGLPASASDATARTGNPLFVNTATHPSGDMSGPALSLLTGFQLQRGSPAINAGVVIANNGGFDFWNTPLYVGAPDIGPFESP